MATPTARSTSTATRRWVCALILASAGLALVVGCDIQKRMQDNRVFWSKFIDGIPDPNAPAAQDSPGLASANAPAAVILSTHKPFEQQDCKSCHKGDPTDIKSLLATSDSSVCTDCHQPVFEKHRVLHGPVAAKACLWCHAPHNSPQPLLLRTAAPDLCMQCHDRQLLGETTPEHQNVKADCLSCHFGHGGEKRFFLKPAAIIPPPATQPQGTRAEVLP